MVTKPTSGVTFSRAIRVASSALVCPSVQSASQGSFHSEAESSKATKSSRIHGQDYRQARNSAWVLSLLFHPPCSGAVHCYKEFTYGIECLSGGDRSISWVVVNAFSCYTQSESQLVRSWFETAHIRRHSFLLSIPLGISLQHVKYSEQSRKDAGHESRI